MKRLLIIVLAGVLLLASCEKEEITKTLEADNISVFYGVSSYAMSSARQDIIDYLLNQFNSLTFEKAEGEIDFASTFHVSFYYKGKSVKSFSVDKNGLFWIDGTTQCYRVSSGSFDYERLKEVYENSRRIPSRTALPPLEHRKFALESIGKSLEKKLSKDELVSMVNEITKPTQEKPNLGFSSNPYDYIEAHRDEYNRIVEGGQSTVNVFVGILRNSTEFGLDKYIMAAACAEITGIGSGSDKTWATAKEWLELYEERSEKP